MQILFFVGNKRSGTSHAVRVLNAHPQIFVAPEADLVWALYCRQQGLPMQPFPDDGPRGLQATLEGYGDVLRSHSSVRSSFEAVLRAMACKAGKDPDLLQVVGDKKPVQQSDPDIWDFALTHWPEARFIHIPRHPRAAVSSMIDGAAGSLSFMDCWKRSDEELVDLWARNEKRVTERRLRQEAPIHTVPFHALVQDPVARWKEVLDFLQLDPHPAMQAAIEGTRTGVDGKYEKRSVPITAEAAAIVEMYGLELAL